MIRSTLRRLLHSAAIMSIGLAGVGIANDFPSVATIYLQSADGTETGIGQVSFKSSGGDTGISVDMDHQEFSEHFLSMRPFRCLEGSSEWFCYLEYPYKLRNIISPQDLSDLEYQLLFIRKLPAEFGIDAWNGLYYILTLNESGVITGELMEGDLNVLQSPPPNDFDKPVDLQEFIPVDKTKRLYPTLEIRPN